ncbi:MAG TPA: hypothetical protein VHO06_05670, partial [Polyangia bacterium]|nr:hypothetical protein [Polyangia bacterium]
MRRLGLVGALASTVAFGACATTNRMMGRNEQTWTLHPAAAPVEAAQGKVEIAAKENGNHDLRLEVQHLAPPQTAFGGSSVYVVWLKPANGQPQNVGVLQVDKDYKGELDTKTPFANFEVMVTAEPD